MFQAVRCFRSESAAKSGKRGRRLVLNTETGTVSQMAYAYADGESVAVGMATLYEGVASIEGLSLRLAETKTPIVLTDDALSAYVDDHDGQLPAEGLEYEAPVLDDFVDERPAAVARRAKAAEREAVAV